MNILAHDFAAMSAPLLRLNEAKFLLNRFNASRNVDPNEGLFLLTVYFDSFLFSLISVEEMVDDQTRAALRAMDSFLFFKALRNVSTHHSVLSGLHGKFERPISRKVSIGIGCDVDYSEQFYFIPERLRDVFKQVLAERQGEKWTLAGAGRYLDALEAAGGDIMVADSASSVVRDVESLIK
ncbi:hypothetical protein [Stenotrophomonas sp.]|uniref:hypothetical protein n=1 Tax=Stenotrophomonas sp. TaxID=69392 RepID=UPI00289E48D9|nr:hypothetical protein [Stenotrophomonas sp.]